MSPNSRWLRAAMLALAGALLVPSSSPAQRRVIGAKPATEETPADVKPAEDKKPDEKPAEEKKPVEEKKPEQAKPVDEPKPASDRRPVGAEPRKELPPAPPTVLVPKDEQGAPVGQAKSGATAAKVDEVLYRKKIDKTSVSLRVRPAKPVPGKTTTIFFEVVKILSVPDPSLGDRVPLENANLFVTIGKDGSPAVRYRLHALPDAGIYGVHFTVPEAGAYRLQLDQRLENAEIGDKALGAEFVLGIGQETAMQAAEEESAVKTGRGRTALKASDAGPTEGAGVVMRGLGEGWLELSRGLAGSGSGGDLVGAARALSDASTKLAGQVPAALSAQRREFDALAGELSTALKELVAVVGEDGTKARAQMAKIETDQCARCHVKFRYQIAEDVTAWPKFTPRPPKDAPAQRKPLH